MILIIIQATGCLTGVSCKFFLNLFFVDFFFGLGKFFEFFSDNSYMKFFSDTKMEFLKIYHDEIERQHMMSANMTECRDGHLCLRDGHLAGEDGHDDHDDHDHDDHDHDDHDDDFYDLDTIARDVMAHDPYVLLEQMMFRWVRFPSAHLNQMIL